MKNIDNIPGKNPFRVPDNYFEEVNKKIISSTAGSEPEVKNDGILKRMMPYLLAAASVTGFVIISYVATKYLTTDRTHSASEAISSANFAEPYIDDIDLFTLEESASAIDLPDDISGVINSEIIDYLILENIEINEIYEQL